MAKLKLLGIGKSAKHIHYTFPKKQEFFQIVRDLLKHLGFEVYEWDGYGRPTDKKWNEPIFNKEMDIKTFTDLRNVLERDEYYIEIIYGKDRVFLTIHTEKDRQQKISKFMNKFILD